MKHEHILSGLLTLLVFLSGSLRLQAADDVVQQIPNNALAFVVVKNMQQFSLEVDQTAQRMQFPAPHLLAMAKERLHLAKGVVDAGEMAVVLVGREADSPFPVIFVRSNNYEELRRQLKPDQQEGPTSRVIVGEEPMIIAKKGDYAVFTRPAFREGLKQVVESKESIEVDDQTQAFIQQADAYAVATNNGVKMLSQQAIGALQIVKQQFADSPQGETVVAAFGMYEELFKWASREVGQVVLTLAIDDSGALSLMKRVDFQNPEEYTAPGATANATKRLAQLPKWPYVMAFAAEIGDSNAMDKWLEMSMGMMRTMAGPQQLTDEQLDKLIAASRKSMEGLRAMSFAFGVPEAGGSIYSRMGMVMEVEDAQAFINNYVQAMQQMQQIFADNERMPYRILTAEKVQVAGVQGMKAVMQIMPAALGPGSEQVKQMFDKLYGEEGKIEVYAAPIDPQHIALAYVSQESLREVIQAAKSPNGWADDKGIQTTAKLLSDKAQMVGYISPEGSLQFVQRIIAALVPDLQQGQIPKLPDFPSSPPLGLSLQYNGKALEAEMVAPVETLIALGEFIQAVQSGAELR